MPYRSEQQFSTALIPHLKQWGMVQRIETPETSRGVPDIYFRPRAREFWLEIKNEPRASVAEINWEIRWRAGQQAWAHEYHVHSGLYSYTIAAFKDGFAVIPMKEHFVKNMVNISQCMRMTQIADIIEVLKQEVER